MPPAAQSGRSPVEHFPPGSRPPASLVVPGREESRRTALKTYGFASQLLSDPVPLMRASDVSAAC